MAQHDYNIANQSFPSFRTDLNNALSAIQTCNSGTSRPTGAVAGQIWLDTTSATSPTLKYYDGADDISLATIDHVGNTVNWLDSTVSITGLTTTATGTVLTLTDTHLNSTVSIRLPNATAIADDSGNEYIKFAKTASAVNEISVTNSATTNSPTISATGDDTNIGINITPKGTGGAVFSAGAVATPAITTTGDLNTGIWFPTADTIATSTGGTERLRIDSSGNVKFSGNIGLGGTTPTTSGTGITFPATQSASTDANTLDDYEEGTWTPALTNLTINSGTVVTSGTYTKIGRLVLINWEIIGTYNITITANSTRINNLPFSVGTAAGVFIPTGSITNFYGIVASGVNAYSASTISNTTQSFVGTLTCQV